MVRLIASLVGAAFGDPRRIGADFAFTALFIALVASLWRGRVTFWTVAAAGGASALTYRFIGPPWPVAAGAMCGLAAAWLAAGRDLGAPSPAVLVAVIAPSALATGWPETAAALVAAVAATRLPLLGVVAVGVLAVVGFRAL